MAVVIRQSLVISLVEPSPSPCPVQVFALSSGLA